MRHSKVATVAVAGDSRVRADVEGKAFTNIGMKSSVRTDMALTRRLTLG